MKLTLKFAQIANPLRLLALAVLPALAMARAAAAQTLTTLYSFDNSISVNLNGYDPDTALVQGTDGRLYGAAWAGGESPSTGGGAGTIYKITTDGAEKTIASFCPSFNQCPTGANPNALLQGTDGNFYGTTNGGGIGFGTVFKVTPAGVLTALHTFCSTGSNGFCPDGSTPNSLIEGSDGNLYGTTFSGGNSVTVNGAYGAGTIFKTTKAGKLTTLYAFCSAANCTDGSLPIGGLIEATNGYFYGIATSVAFKLSPGGTFTTLATLASNSKGALLQAADGYFYGTLANGTVFRMTAAGRVKTFATTDGTPYAGLIQGTDGNFYGTNYVGGPNSNPGCQAGRCGSIFQITPTGTVTTLYNFCSQPNCTDGSSPLAGLMQDTNGLFYGTTQSGGAHSPGFGTVFSLDMGLGPFVATRPNRGLAGASIKILGDNLTGTTSITFNGTPATFTVLSATQIEAAVPTGATTGAVQVTTPSGTLASNTAFTVVP
jgi:uncharacterized repeat protein (TIGR03803 family)